MMGSRLVVVGWRGKEGRCGKQGRTDVGCIDYNCQGSGLEIGRMRVS